MIQFSKRKLRNGMHVLLSPLHETEAVTVLVMTKVGSRYESARNNGVSHFLEHMMFKGTDRRPTALDVAKELDSIGADFNAFTSKDFTGYYVKANRAHLTLALDLMADILWHSNFAASEVERERTVIIEEINMYEDNPIMLIGDLFEQTLYGAHHPLGRLIAGPKSVIRRMDRTMIVDYFRQHYYPANMVLGIAGHFPEKSTLQSVEKLFGPITHRTSPTPYKRFHVTQRSPRVSLLHRDTQQVQLGMGYPALPYKHKDLPALQLLSIILGGNMSSRLFTSVREREGLAYSIHASADQYQDTGSFFIQAGLDTSRIGPAIRLILSELQRVQRDGVSPEELTNAKEFLRGKFTLSLEDSEQIAAYLTKQQLLTGVIHTPEQRLRQLGGVRRADVRSVARRIFRSNRLTLALVGPLRNPERFRALVRKSALSS